MSRAKSAPLRGVSYARFSTEMQSEASLQDQRHVCQKIADREGVTLVGHFEDAAISGGTSRRPGYQQLLEGARGRQFNVIVVEDSSRLWREMSEQWRALKEFQDLEIHVIGHGIDTRREESNLLLAVTGASAEAYRDEIARRTRRGLEGRARARASTGGKSFGYIAARDAASKQIEIDPAQASVVVRIFEAYARGESPARIAQTLNLEGIASPGSSWNRSVRRTQGWMASAIVGSGKTGVGILRNPRYCGQIVFGRARWERGAADSKRRRMKMLDAPLYVYTEPRLRIIDEVLWAKVQARLAANAAEEALRVQARGSARTGGPRSQYLLSSLLRCAHCESAYTVVNRYSYGCAGHTGGRLCPGPIHYVGRAAIEAKVLDALEAIWDHPDSLGAIERYAVEYLTARPKVASHPRPADQALSAELGRLGQLVATGEADSVVLGRIAELTSRLGKASPEPAEQPRCLPTPKARELVKELMSEFREYSSSIRARFVAGEIERAREDIRQAVGTIRLTGDAERDCVLAECNLRLGPEIESHKLLKSKKSVTLVAGVGFEPTTFGL